jgi:hypothetical protein
MQKNQHTATDRVWQPLPVFVVTSWSALLAMPAAPCLSPPASYYTATNRLTGRRMTSPTRLIPPSMNAIKMNINNIHWQSMASLHPARQLAAVSHARALLGNDVSNTQ